MAAECTNPDLAHAVIAWMIGLPIFIAVVWVFMVWPERERWTKPAPVYGSYHCDRCCGVPVLSVKQKAKQVGISR